MREPRTGIPDNHPIIHPSSHPPIQPSSRPSIHSSIFLRIWRRLRERFRRRKDLFNLQVEPAYAIKASARVPYFVALERVARQAGFLGTFIVDEEGRLRPGRNEALATRQARLTLDVYPNPAAIEGRTVADYDDHSAPRRTPRVGLVLENEEELYLRSDREGLRLEWGKG